MNKFYLTTPIYYPNARPHVGSAYTTIVCDVIARYRRMCGDDVAFLTGTDEHGEKIQRAADAEGKPPGEFVATKRELFKNLWQFLNINDFKFVHTSGNPDHVRAVQWMLRQAAKNGCIEKKKYEGRYCVSDERYISDNAEPVNCDICGRPGELIREENYFFKLSAFQSRLLELYDNHPEFVRPGFRLNEVKSFVRSGLRDISVSRKHLKWGIPWPDDPEQVFYVWYDALTSYMTGIGFGSEDPARKAEFEKYWPADLHMIGKDILRFHAVYWPAFLMAAFPNQPEKLPTTVFAHGWIYYEQGKMSKSKGNVVYPEPIVEALDSFGAPGNDALRYYLLREASFGQDTSFSYEALIRRYNSDLANDLGNLVNRTLAMIGRFSGGNVYPPGDITAKESEIEKLIRQAWDKYQTCFNSLSFSQALDAVWVVVAKLNLYLVESQPWKLGQNPGPSQLLRLKTVLSTVAGALRILTVLLAPVLPNAAKRIWKQLGLDGSPGEPGILRDPLKPIALIWDPWMGHISKPEIVFPRLEKESAMKKLEALEDAEPASPPDKKVGSKSPEKGTTAMGHQPEEKPATESRTTTSPQPLVSPAGAAPSPGPAAGDKISIEDFAKVDMRVGEIVSAEAVPNATKLLKLMVDIGTEVRQVVAGIAGYYEPEQLVGMKVVLVTNLQPRKLRGVESNGMVVAATVGPEGRPVLATFREDVPKGAKLK